MNKHTPGPWVGFVDNDIYSVMPAMRPGTICEYIANPGDASLIAAAPDLLEALRAFVDNCPYYKSDDGSPFVWHRIFREARAAIAKATGERKKIEGQII